MSSSLSFLIPLPLATLKDTTLFFTGVLLACPVYKIISRKPCSVNATDQNLSAPKFNKYIM